MSFNQPLGGNAMPRFGGPATMMRLPSATSAANLDACFVGIPMDIGASNRPGTRLGPRQIRDESRMIRPYNMATGAAPFDVMQVADAAVPPIPRASPVARPMVAMASATGNASPRTAADAIADAVGSRNDNAAPVMAYAPVDAGSPHIDASSGALVAGRAASLRGSAKSSGKADAHLVPVGYSVATLQLVMRSGSMRQMDYAELAMPHPFSVPEFFAAAETTKVTRRS